MSDARRADAQAHTTEAGVDRKRMTLAESVDLFVEYAIRTTPRGSRAREAAQVLLAHMPKADDTK